MKNIKVNALYKSNFLKNIILKKLETSVVSNLLLIFFFLNHKQKLYSINYIQL